jgi:hypothetical protein
MNLTTMLEMAQPTEAESKINFYHGTSSEALGQKILRDGFIKPRDVIFDKLGRRMAGSATTSLEGRTYVSPNLEFVISYVLGGNIAGDDSFEAGHDWHYKLTTDPYGYLFIIHGTNLQDITPDEDSVGELLYLINKTKKQRDYYDDTNLKNSPLTYDEQWLVDIAKSKINARMLHRINTGEYSDWAAGGKILMRYLAKDPLAHRRIFNLLRKYDNLRHVIGVAHTGQVKFSQAWRFPKKKTKQLKSDCSNFFNLAERIV